MWFYILATAATGAVVYEWSTRARYIIRHVFMYGFALFAGFCCIPQGLLYRPCDLRNGSRFVRPLRFVSWVFGLRWYVRGADLLRERSENEVECLGGAGGGAVVVCNHQSAVDILGMVELWPTVGKLASVIKREVWLGLPFALAAWLCGQIFIDRRNPATAKLRLVEVAQRVRDERFKLWVFPEGTRGDGRKLLPFKKGAFHLAVQAQLPIVPVVISSYRNFLRKDECHFSSGDIILEVLPAISTQGLSGPDDVDKLVERIQTLMENKFKELTSEVASGSHLKIS